MAFGKRTYVGLALCVALAASGCSSGGGSSVSQVNSVQSITQDLDLDADGLTTVVAFAESPGVLTTASFSADGGQMPVTVTRIGNSALIIWSARVTPSHEVTVLGVPGVAETPRSVATTNSGAPAVTVTSAVQTAGLGNDSLEVTLVGGPRVDATAATDPASWRFVQEGVAMDLSGTTITLDAPNQVVSFDLDASVNLHASFTIAPEGLTTVADVAVSTVPVAGAPLSPDLLAPTLISAQQNLAADEYGRVIDFTFSEAMDPFFAVALPNFDPGWPNIATNLTQLGAGTVLRVTFQAPVVPGVHSVDLDGLMDAHGNDFPTAVQAIALDPAPHGNAFEAGSPVAEAVANEGGDTLTVTTTRALEPVDAIDPASWSLTVDAAPVPLGPPHVLSYDLLAKTLLVEFVGYELPFGANVSITGVNVLEVDGGTFGLGGGVLVTGDSTAPAVSTAVQNRTLDTTGTVVDVTLTEDLDETSAETPGNWTVSGGQNVTAADLQGNQRTVRLTLDAPVVPGDDTITAQNVADLALNAMPAPDANNALTSTDATAPSPTSGTAAAVEGAFNDTLVVVFNDAMVEAEVTDPTLWALESPVGTPVDCTAAAVTWNGGTRTATLVFDTNNPFFFRNDDDFRVSFTTMRDIGGNVVSATAVTGTVVPERERPEVHTVWREGANNGEVVVRFDEACDHLTDLYDSVVNPDGTRYVLRDGGGVLLGYATTATALDGGLGVRVGFGLVVDPTDTVDVLGLTDLAGNVLFPSLFTALAVEDDGQPPLFADGTLSVTAVSGEDNDTFQLVFDRPMSPWNLTSPAAYTATRVAGGVPLDLSAADFAFDGVDTVTVTLDAAGADDVLHGAAYDFTAVGVWSAQGAELTVLDTEVNVTAAGDGDGGPADAPDVLVGAVTIDPLDANSLVIVATEALDATEAETATNYNYDGGNLATSVTLVGPRTVRATFAVAPVIGNTIDVTCTDRAGNSALVTRAVAAADVQEPLVAAFSGTAVAGSGGDYVSITFDEPVDVATATSSLNYGISNGATGIDLSGATFRYESATNTVEIRLAAGQELDVTQPLSLILANVADHSGNVIVMPVTPNGVVGGDTTAPDLDRAFVNYRADAGGLTVDVLFTEDVDEAFVTDPLAWSVSGGQTVQSATALAGDHVRLVLDAPLGLGHTLDLTGLPDLAGNVSGAVTTTPVR